MNDDELSGISPGTPLSSDELERVIRRAAELQTARESLPDSLGDDEVIRIGAEVGLQEHHLRRALLEIRAESLMPEPPPAGGLPARLWGEARVQASRVVPGGLDEVQLRLGEYLRAGESLRQVRDQPGFTIWEPASDVMSQIRRGFNVGGHDYALAKARRIEVAIRPIEEGRCLVTVVADLRKVRAEHAGGWYTGAGFSTLGGTLALVLAAGFPVLAAAPLAAGVAFGGGTLLARRTLRAEVERVELAVQGLLDRLERGDRIGSRRSGLMDRIQGLIAEEDG